MPRTHDVLQQSDLVPVGCHPPSFILAKSLAVRSLLRFRDELPGIEVHRTPRLNFAVTVAETAIPSWSTKTGEWIGRRESVEGVVRLP
jgi:hypothetical protein